MGRPGLAIGEAVFMRVDPQLGTHRDKTRQRLFGSESLYSGESTYQLTRHHRHCCDIGFHSVILERLDEGEIDLRLG